MLSRQNGTGVEASVPFFMLSLLAESKTMSTLQSSVSMEEFKVNKPLFEEDADYLMNYISLQSPSKLAEILGISNQLAIKAHQLAYDFPHKSTGYQAIKGFIGDAYRGLDISTIPDEILNSANDKLRIISSVYGIMRPDDIIKPYRCEFNKEILPNRQTPIKFYKQKITIEFVKYLKQQKVKEIINLLPADADKCLDWKIIRAFSSTYKVVFQAVTSEGKLKTPIAKRLKELRGLMCREILLNNINSFEELKNFESPHFIYSPEESKPLLPVFVTTE